MEIESENVLDLMIYLIIFFVIAFILVNFILPTKGNMAVDWEKSSIIILLFVMAFLVSMQRKWLVPVPVRNGSTPESPVDHMEEKLLYQRF